MEYIKSYTFEADRDITAYELYLVYEWGRETRNRIRRKKYSMVQLFDPFYQFDDWPNIPKEIERFLKKNMGEKPDAPATGWKKFKYSLGIG